MASQSSDLFDTVLAYIRGIQMCLPVWNIDDNDLLTYSTILERVVPEVKALAWIYCELENQLLCMVLDCSEAEMKLDCRALPYPFMTVDKSLRDMFKIKQLYLMPNDPEISLQMLRRKMPFKATYSEIHVLSENAILIESLPETTNLSTGRFSGAGDFTIALTLSLLKHAQTVYFQLICGIQNQKHWCHFGDESANRQDLSLEKLWDFYVDSRHLPKKLHQSSDRLAMISNAIPGLVITASFRRGQGGKHYLEISNYQQGDENLCLGIYMESSKLNEEPPI
ncbi:unnamed protein product [Clonostachys rosea]|uniref:HNH nuclease domain-containing protein n=1 Tax=Bionectria ochroleuca TaxID=29856 RepID=A0ABY6UKT4_BIOOC|nr:unnamed protein product [Clonostachys rosea]